jgi:multidrug resistance protein
MPSSTPIPSTRRALAVVLLTVFLDLLGFGMVIPILPLYARDLHASVPEITRLLAIYSVMQLLFAPIWGRLSDRIGRRPVLLLSIFGSCASQLGYALSPTLPFLMLSRAIAGICGANIAAAQAYVADVTDERSRAGAMGMVGAALGLGFIFGPALGGQLSRIDPRAPFLAGSFLAAVNFALAYVLLREPPRHHVSSAALSWEALLRLVRAPRLLALLGIFFIVTFGFANMEGVFSLYCQDRFHYGAQRVGWLFALVGVVMAGVQGLLVRRLAPRLGEGRMLSIGIAVMGLGLLSLALAQGLGLLLFGIFCIAAGSGLNNPSLSSLLTRAAGEQKGGVLGVSQSLGALGRIVGPVLGGEMYDALGSGAPLFFASICMALALVLAVVLTAAALAHSPHGAQALARPAE